MAQRRMDSRRISLAVTFFIMVGLLAVGSQSPAHAVSVDGPPVIGQDPPVPQSGAPTGRDRTP